MINKTFVSIFFSTDRLQVLELTSSKKKVTKFTSVSLPAGLISNYKVSNRNALAKIIRNLWDKLELKEKAAGLVVPEFSTFTKLFSLPKLTLPELDEAVRWQAQDFLPSQLSDMVMDWKIVKTENDGYQLLAAAMDKEILEGYVEAVVEAGLFPMVVETPSLSLVRLSSREETGKLILYNNFGEGILVISEGEKIFGSSIVPIEEKDELIKTSSRILAHYKEVEVKKVIIGGAGLDNTLAKSLEEKLNIKVEWIKPEVTGLTDSQIQEYLVPLSLQLKEPAKPSDENTINLLPGALVTKYERERFKLQLWGLTLTITLFVWISFLAALGSYLFLTREVSALRERNSLKQKAVQEKVTAIAQVKEINQLADKILKIKSVSVYPQKVLGDINNAKSSGIIVSKYKINLDRGDVELEGTAVDRLTLVDFKQKLEGNQNISSVTIPISSFEVENNLEFKMSFTYSPFDIKKKIDK